jgi:hypothetical protein
MAWVEFVADFEFDFRPQKACCQIYLASSEPRELPERVVAAAVAAGAGVRVELPDDEKRAIKRAGRRKQKEL